MTEQNLSGYIVKLLIAVKLLIVCIGLSLAGLTYAQDEKVAKYATADAQLKNTYKQLMEKVDTQDKKKLSESQRRWNAFRNADCEYGLVDKFDCLLARTEERIQQLKDRPPRN